MPFATGSDMLARYDARLLGDLVRDDGTQEPSVSLAANANLTAAITDATAVIQSAIVVGNRYTLSQISSLSDSSESVLRRICCDLALIYLKRRRGKFNAENDGPLLESVEASIKSLRDGENLLMIGTATESPASVAELSVPTLVTIQNRHTLRDTVKNYFPMRRHSTIQ